MPRRLQTWITVMITVLRAGGGGEIALWVGVHRLQTFSWSLAASAIRHATCDGLHCQKQADSSKTGTNSTVARQCGSQIQVKSFPKGNNLRPMSTLLSVCLGHLLDRCLCTETLPEYFMNKPSTSNLNS